MYYFCIVKNNKNNNIMTTSRFAVGTEVMNSKGMKGIITMVITKSTGYVAVKWESGKITREMAFNLTDVEGNSLKSKPAKREDNRTPQQRLADELMSFARTTRTSSTFEMEMGILGKFIAKMMNIDGLAGRVAATIDATMNPYGAVVARMSDKQAWILAGAAIENGINL